MNGREPSRRRATNGAIAGFVLRLARESIPLTQAGFAEVLRVDLATVQGWESGRRPVANMKVGALLALRRRLPALGSAPLIVALLDPAMDADRIVGAALDQTSAPHPLTEWVHTRTTAHMIAWAANGTAPPGLADRPVPPRRGAVPTAPLLATGDRVVFFDHLRMAAESADRTGERGVLLHRQALYLSSYDRSPDAMLWTAQALHARRDVLAARGWTPRWAEARSTAAALARLGDPDPLLTFIERALVDDDVAEAANLNYLAYWLGALPQAQADDRFMVDRTLSAFDPVTLLRRLNRGLHQAPGYVDLYVHSLWALLTAHPWLPLAAPESADLLREQTAELLDGGRTSSRAKRELARVHYVLGESRKG
ncbi:helix-turn-helix domain-containing protein [Streptomyces sp. NPDC050504]|uniref:helix-turn-helix domain-containing protein n=1 Tax=Streptomyces sp. NPDC050504 TaxID=3365618 RepID=UPI0037A36891